MALPYFDNSVAHTTWWIWAVLTVALTAVILVLYDFITFVAEHLPKPTDEEKGGGEGGKTTDKEKDEKISPKRWAPRLSTGQIWKYIRAYIGC